MSFSFLKWEHAIVVCANIFMAAVFQTLFFTLYLNSIVTTKLFKETSELVDSASLCSVLAPLPLHVKNPVPGQDATVTATSVDYFTILSKAFSSEVNSRAIEKSKKQRGDINRKIHWKLILIISGIFFVLLGCALMAVINGELSVTEILVIMTVGVISYISELLFFFFVVKKYKYFTKETFIYEFTKPPREKKQ